MIGNGGIPVGQVSNAVAVGLSYVQSAALTTDGRVIQFDSGYGQPPGLTNVIAFDVAGQFNDDDLDYKLAVTQDGRVVVWGHYGHPPAAEVSGEIAAAGGWSHIVALKSDGTLVQWDIDNEPAPVAGLSNVVAVAAGGTHSVALKADGKYQQCSLSSEGNRHWKRLIVSVIDAVFCRNYLLFERA